MTHFHLIHDIETVKQDFPNFHIGVIDGKSSSDLNEFFEAIGNAFNFPDYFGHNFDALDEILNDLDWLDTSGYCLVIDNIDFFLKNESNQTRKKVLDLFSKVATEWKSVPNFEGEEHYREKSDFNIYLVNGENTKEEYYSYLN